MNVSTDSSPQSFDFVALEGCASPARLAELTEADLEELEVWSEGHVLRTTVLPPAIVGYGNATLPSKVEASFPCVKLDVGTIRCSCNNTQVPW